jgi:polynucleotide 5'-kinase involved in rRNA processing
MNYDIILMVRLILNKILKPLTAYSNIIGAIVFKFIGLARTKFEFETPTLY